MSYTELFNIAVKKLCGKMVVQYLEPVDENTIKIKFYREHEMLPMNNQPVELGVFRYFGEDNWSFAVYGKEVI